MEIFFKKKVPYKRAFIVIRNILTSYYILDMVIVIVTKIQCRMDRLFEWRELFQMKINHLPDLKIQNIRFVVGVIRSKWLRVRSKEFSPRLEKIYQEEMRISIRMLALSWFWHSSSIKQNSRNIKKDTYK